MPPASASAPPTVREQLLRECAEMARHALASGKQVSPALLRTLDETQSAPAGTPPDIGLLVGVHDRLAKLVAPATPQGLTLMAESRATYDRLNFLGPVRLVRQMMGAAVICMVLFILISSSQFITDDPATNILERFGPDLLVNELFWLAAAGIGSAFAILFQVNDFVVKSSYDPKYEPSYWIKFSLGVIAGFVLVALLPLEAPQDDPVMQALMDPTLALLGGFSATAVYRIMSRLVDTVESLFRGDTRSVIEQREQEAKSRAAEETSQTRLALAARLVELQGKIAAGMDPDEVAKQVKDFAASLLGEHRDPEPAPAPAPPAEASAPAAVAPAKVPALAVVGAPTGSSDPTSQPGD